MGDHENFLGSMELMTSKIICPRAGGFEFQIVRTFFPSESTIEFPFIDQGRGFRNLMEGLNGIREPLGASDSRETKGNTF